MSEVLIVSRDARGVATLRLNRPAARNALDPHLTDRLHSSVQALAADRSLRAAVLTGAGGAFCAGGDIKSMRSALAGDRASRLARSRGFANLLAALRALPVPVIACVNGPAYGGGVGLVAVADIALAAETAEFGLSEPRVGIAPATISPYVLERVGPAAARRLFLTARRFDAAEGLRVGLYHRVVPGAALDAAVEDDVAAILKCSPTALAACKRLVAEVPRLTATEATEHTARALADLWETDDAREGIAAFAEKRTPRWARGA